MGAIIEDLDDPEGYALWRLADGSVIPAWSSGVSEFSGYVARCACGCHAQRQHPPTEAGYEQAIDQWVDEHALAELARQASRRREDLGRVLAWFGTQAGRLQDPASLDRPVAWIAPASSSSSSSVTWTARRPSGRPTVSGDRPLAVWSDRRIGEHGRAICQQRTLPTHPGLAGEQAAVLEEWARRWRQRGPHDLPGQVELGLLEDFAAELRRIATGIVRQPSPHGRSTVSAERPSTPSPTQLGEDQGLPGEFLVGFTERLLDRRAELLAESQAPAEAREQAVAEAV
jgi:hypothetical protein